MGAALFADEAQFVKAVLAHDVVETHAIEATIETLKHRILEDQASDGLIGNGEAELFHLMVERGFRNHALKDLPVDTKGARLFIGDGAAHLALQILQLRLIGLAIILR